MSREGIELPSVKGLIELHAEVLAAHGGPPGLRDRGILEAALAHPHQLLAYSEKYMSVSDLAAALCVSIVRGHAFVDGNKRMGLIALGVTLAMNGLDLDIAEREAARVILELADNKMDEPTFREWVHRNTYEMVEPPPED